MNLDASRPKATPHSTRISQANPPAWPLAGLMVLALFWGASHSGCSKSGGESEATSTSAASASAAKAPATGASASTAPSDGKAATENPGAGAKETPGTAEATGETTAEATRAADPATIAVNLLLRSFFADLAAGQLDEARKRMISQEECEAVWTDPAVCVDIVKGCDGGMESLRNDPVQAGSKIIEMFVGDRQTVPVERGVKAETGIWVGHIIIGQTPDGHQFALRSIGVLETPAGLRILWGTRKSGGDSPRSPPAEGAEADGTAPGGPAPGAKPAATGEPAEAKPAAPATPPDATKPTTPPAPAPEAN